MQNSGLVHLDSSLVHAPPFLYVLMLILEDCCLLRAATATPHIAGVTRVEVGPRRDPFIAQARWSPCFTKIGDQPHCDAMNDAVDAKDGMQQLTFIGHLHN